MNEFVVGFRSNREFDLLVAANFTIEGTGAATFLMSLLYGSEPGLYVGLILVFLGIAALILDLGNPMRSWKVILKTSSAWISRGSIFIGCLCFLGALYVLAPFIRNSSFIFAIEPALVLLGLLTMLYTGFVVSSMASIPFWNTPLIPLLFLSHSMASGISVLLCILSVTGHTVGGPFNPVVLELILLVTTLFLLAVHVMVLSRSSGAARESVKRLTRGELRSLFFGGAILLGIVVPVGVMLPAALASGGAYTASSLTLFIAMGARLTGDFCSRLVILRAGVYEPLIE